MGPVLTGPISGAFAPCQGEGPDFAV
ncbi:uncharacterized protein G2W53_042071 [Senna tora]|uniref:Uncharacterized protein n=1 Tax=Senna tora TaxID=362788 RepID=A0A834SER3_9FABA|nr:uncharacterized protein G2W53_042071 [Senna tora]